MSPHSRNVDLVIAQPEAGEHDRPIAHPFRLSRIHAVDDSSNLSPRQVPRQRGEPVPANRWHHAVEVLLHRAIPTKIAKEAAQLIGEQVARASVWRLDAIEHERQNV